MFRPTQSQPEIADVVALTCALDRDEQRTASELLAREKRLATGLPSGEEDRTTVALAWLDAVKAEDDTVRSIHQRAETTVQVTGFAVVAAAVVLGWMATLGAFYFDGSGRVNAVSVLAVLIVLPGLFLIPFAVAALPVQFTRRVPGAGLVLAVGRAFSAGRVVSLLWRVMPRDLRDSMALISGRLGKHQTLYASLQKWAVLRWSQLFALTFQLTALAACLVLVVFTDLAFGWSTTLTTGDPVRDAQRVHRVTTVMASPWRMILPEAQPGLALIEESRYFRAAATSITPAEAARLGGWWQFVALAIGGYGVMPRLLTFWLARTKLRAATQATVAASPGLSAVLRRLHRVRVESAALEPEQGAATGNVATAINPPPATSEGGRDHVRAVINWAGAPEPSGGWSAHLPRAVGYAAGGGVSLADDLALAKKLGAAGGGDAGADVTLLIVVKGWEPPLMEFLDFLTALRAALTARERTMLVVLPVGLGDDQPLPVATAAQVELWRKKLAGLGDPRLRVARDHGEVCA